MPEVASVLSSLRYLFADIIGERGRRRRHFCRRDCPTARSPIVSDGIHLLIDYQGTSYAQLYVDRLQRFIGRRGVDEAMLGEIARLMAHAHELPGSDPDRAAEAH